MRMRTYVDLLSTGSISESLERRVKPSCADEDIDRILAFAVVTHDARWCDFGDLPKNCLHIIVS